MKFPDMVHSLKPAPDTNVQTPDRYWDFMSLTPESTHMLTWVFSDYGTPANYREMNGFGVHAFKWINSFGNYVYVKYHWKPHQGVRNLSKAEASAVQGEDFSHATRDLYDAIANGNFPKWDLHVQLLQPEDLDAYDFDPLDPTKVWPEDIIPLHKVGTMTLNRNPQNFFAEVEQAAFAPSVLVAGIEPSEDKLLQGRLFSYPDTQRHRLGPNYLQIPVNCPYATVRNNQRDGAMQMKPQSGSVNYEPTRHDDAPKEVPEYRDSSMAISGSAARQKLRKQMILPKPEIHFAASVNRSRRISFPIWSAIFLPFMRNRSCWLSAISIAPMPNWGGPCKWPERRHFRLSTAFESIREHSCVSNYNY